jgi:hypothetical protein
MTAARLHRRRLIVMTALIMTAIMILTAMTATATEIRPVPIV